MARKISELPAADTLDGSESLALVQAGATRRSAVGALLSPALIDGLQLQWLSGTALTVTTGLAMIPSLGRTVRVNAPLAKAGLALVASAWHHVYLWLNAAVPDIEIVTTAPDAPYFATARAKPGDTSRRYLGSVLTDAAGQLFNFLHSGHTMAYQVIAQNAPFRVLSSGASTAKTEVSVAGAVPITARVATLSCNATSDTSVRLGNANDGGVAVGEAIYAFKGGATVIVPMPLTATGTFNYGYTAAPTNGGGLIVDVTGYQFER